VWNFDFSSIWTSLNSLRSYFSSTPNTDTLNENLSSAEQCTETLNQTCTALAALTQRLQAESGAMVNNPREYKELFQQVGTLGHTLVNLSEGLGNYGHSTKPSGKTKKDPSIQPIMPTTEEVEIDDDQRKKTVMDQRTSEDLFDELMMEVEPLPKPEKKVVAKQASQAAPNIMDLMSTMMGNQQAPKQSTLNPNDWKKEVPKGEIRKWATVFARDAKFMEEIDFSAMITDTYREGSTRANKSGAAAFLGM